MRPGLGEAAELIGPAVRLWREESEDPRHQIAGGKKPVFSGIRRTPPLCLCSSPLSLHLSPGSVGPTRIKLTDIRRQLSLLHDTEPGAKNAIIAADFPSALLFLKQKVLVFTQPSLLHPLQPQL